MHLHLWGKNGIEYAKSPFRVRGNIEMTGKNGGRIKIIYFGIVNKPEPVGFLTGYFLKTENRIGVSDFVGI